MILYKDDTSLKSPVIVTVTGDNEYRVNCRKIKGVYYVKEKDCFLIDKKWYRKESPLIAYDFEKKKVVLKRGAMLREGMVAINPENGEIQRGYFTPNIYNNVTVCYDGFNKDIFYDVAQLKNLSFVEDISSGIWYPEKSLSAELVRKFKTIRVVDHVDHKGYNIEDNPEEFLVKKDSHLRWNPKIPFKTRQYAKYLKDITYGIELETCKGFVPEIYQKRYGLVACKDGSIGSSEFVTVPLTGAKGLHTVKEMCQEMSQRVKVDISCSTHIHIGNIPITREYICALYRLCFLIQDDLFKMFPYYKTEPAGIKAKNYCKKLEKLGLHTLVTTDKTSYRDYINSCYEKIFYLLSEGNYPSAELNKGIAQHPIKNKWERKKSRYFWMNLQNMIFSPRRTAEIRIHSGSVNPTKVSNLLFIFNTIVKYAEKNMKNIFMTDKVSLIDVLNYYKEEFPNSTLSDYLIAYYQSKCQIFKKDLEKGDVVSEHDIKQDAAYKFEYKGQTELF